MWIHDLAASCWPMKCAANMLCWAVNCWAVLCHVVLLQMPFDLFNYLLRQRIIFLAGYVNDKVGSCQQ